jgi:G-protein coupled receptor 98
MDYPKRKSLQLWTVLVMAMLLCQQCESDGVTNGFLSFTKSLIVVSETSNQIPITIRRTGGTVGRALFQVQIEKATQQDFLSTSKSGFLLDKQTEATVNFDLIDDNDPEDNETYTVALVVPTSGRDVPELGSPSSLTLIILKNDDANGVVSFSTDFETVNELQSQENVVTFQLRRARGLYGNITVSWEVINGTTDFVAANGMTSFAGGQRTANLTLQVVPDNVPEAEEMFIVHLIAVFGGGRLDTDNLTATVIINPNDTPIRFRQQTYTVQEGSVVALNITRGIDQFGQPAGSTSEVVSVQYRTDDGQAQSGVDYQGATSTVVFQIGDTQKTIYIQTVNDTSPEDKEDFSVSLFNSSYGTVLSSPSTAVIQIISNDDVFGVFYFQSSASIILDEDDVSNMNARITVIRAVGNTGSVDISWEIKQNSDMKVASSDFFIASATVHFTSGQTMAFFDVQVATDSIPEEAEAFTLALTAVTGGARLAKSLEGAIKLPIVIRDSDDSYGVVTLADLSQQFISKNPRQLHIKLLRSIGAVGSVHINYTVTYLAKGNTNPEIGSTAFVTSPVTAIFDAGKPEITVISDISPSAFLEVGGSFYVDLTSATLHAATLVPPKSPRIGNLSSVSISITRTVGNGAVYFVNSQTMTREPGSGESSNAVLPISRDGSFGKATVNWIILPLLAGSSLDLNTDVLSRNGTVTLEDGLLFSLSPYQLGLNQYYTCLSFV